MTSPWQSGKTLPNLWLRLLAVFLAGASLAACGSVTINSEPKEAEVVAISAGQGKGKVLGKTPFVSKVSDLSDFASDGPLVLQVRKAGYTPQNFIIPDLSGTITLTTALTSATAGSYDDINHVVRLTLKAERLILENHLDEAMAAAQEIHKINDNAASGYDIEGAVYMLKNDLQKSRSAWLRSLELEPDNADTAGMVKLVEGKLGIKAPSEAKAAKGG